MTQEKQDTDRLRRAFALATAFALLLWLIKLTEIVFGLDLSDLSIFPGRPETLPGLALAPLIHGSLSHLFANTAPILVLGTLLVYGYPKAARILLPAVYLGSGLGVWLYARPAWHLGASGLTFGMMFFVFTIGILRWDRRAIALSLVVFLLYGGMIWGIFPLKPDVSFEYHLFGAGIGVLLAFLLRRLDPPPPEKKYSWEDNNAEDDDWRFPERSEGDKDGCPMDDATCNYPERERRHCRLPAQWRCVACFRQANSSSIACNISATVAVNLSLTSGSIS